MIDFDIPVADITGINPGKTLLVTGGMDGDEYAGIEAAYAIIEKYAAGNFDGRLIVVPIVNIPGFKAECSENPIDQKFPKQCYPGKERGTSTEQLLYWLTTQYVDHTDAWLDLHGGAITESITPFLWTFETGVEEVDAIVKKFYEASDTRTVVIEKVGRLSKAGALAHQGRVYVMAESGERGERNTKDIERHVQWTESLMYTLGMLQKEHTETYPEPSVFRNIEYIFAPYDGILRSPQTPTPLVTKGDVLGMCSTYNGTKANNIVAKKTGTILWHKQTMSMRRGDVLWAIGY